MGSTVGWIVVANANKISGLPFLGLAFWLMVAQRIHFKSTERTLPLYNTICTWSYLIDRYLLMVTNVCFLRLWNL